MTTEAKVLQDIKLDTSRRNIRLLRNNSGAVLADKRMIRFGLGNDSKQLNATCKSSDLIGIRPVVITQADVGQTIGQFVAIEAKESTWIYTGTEHELAQKNFIDWVISMGGYAQFSTGPGDLRI